MIEVYPLTLSFPISCKAASLEEIEGETKYIPSHQIKKKREDLSVTEEVLRHLKLLSKAYDNED
jgi:hypothetical protein